jgi:hypothetical protein
MYICKYIYTYIYNQLIFKNLKREKHDEVGFDKTFQHMDEFPPDTNRDSIHIYIYTHTHICLNICFFIYTYMCTKIEIKNLKRESND